MAMPAQHHLSPAMQAVWPARVESERRSAVTAVRTAGAIKVPLATVPDDPRIVSPGAGNPCGGAGGRSERIAMEWWKQNGQALTRDYFRVEDESGLRFWIYRDGFMANSSTRKASLFLPNVHARTVRMSAHADAKIAYAEIGITTNFSFLRGGSHPQDYVHQASELRFPPSAWPTTIRWQASCGHTTSSTIPRSNTSRSF